MAVVIRLQGLKLAADSRDIRKFFTGLKIPDGGVHIIGGELGEAYIIFFADEDARRAMARSGGSIRGAPVKLLLSSKAEMQNVLEASTKAVMLDQKRSVESLRRLHLGSKQGFSFSPMPQSSSASNILFLLGMPFSVTEQDVIKFFHGLRIDAIILLKNNRGLNGTGFVKFASVEEANEGMKRNKEYMGSRFVELFVATEEQWHKAAGHVGMGGSADGNFERGRSPVSTWRTPQHDARSRSPLASVSARRAGDPQEGRVSSGSSHSSSSKYYVFLSGMPFQVTNKDVSDFLRGLHVEDIILLKNEHGQSSGTGLVKLGTREDALDALKRNREYIGPRYVEVSPASEQQWYEAVCSVEMSANADGRFEKGRSPVGVQRNSRRDARSRSPLASRDEATSGGEMCVMLDNLSYALEKENIRAFFRQAKLDNDQVLFLFNADGSRTRSAFVLFKNLRDYCAALSQAQHKELANRHISISPVSREKMIALLTAETLSKVPCESSGGFQKFLHSSSDESRGAEKACLHLRNLPFDVQKAEVMHFLLGFRITEDSVILLCDNKGAGVGEALVVFSTEAEAMNALSLNGRRFLGSEVMLKCITRAEMQEFGVEFPAMRREGYLDKGGEPSYHPRQEYFEPAHVPRTSLQDQRYGPRDEAPLSQQYRRNGSRGDVGCPALNLNSATCLKLVNLPYQITTEEIYDFCYGYRIIPGSVSLLYDEAGLPKSAATVVFESRQEALTAMRELSGRPIGPRKIQLEFI
ncbi:RNA binding motif protein 12Bb [Thalassophryne amazonica]|uniref:RNA binding motif protein 12Bb n=1 Tax=Thalassophryne amazonica TaxID=390379 RepID=UPI001471F715|nr:RNA binding motif protein 12Bb [Thalassophryne amazonica]